MTPIELALPWWLVLPISLLLVAGGLMALIGSLGLLRLKDFYSRVHAPTLGNTLGAGCVLLASILLFSYLEQRMVFHEVVISVLLVLSSPITAMFLMGSARYRDRSERPEEK